MPIPSRFPHLLVILILALAPLLRAEDPAEEPEKPKKKESVSLGLAGGLAFPTGDAGTLMDSKVGFNGGVFLLVPMSGGNLLRPRLDFYQSSVTASYAGSLDYPGGQSQATLSQTYKLSSVSVGVDYLVYFGDEKKKGVYLLLGGGMASNRYSVSDSEGFPSETASNGYVITSTKPYLTVGLGYQFNHAMGLELTYRQTSLGGQEAITTDATTTATASTSTQGISNFSSKTLAFMSIGATLRF